MSILNLLILPLFLTIKPTHTRIFILKYTYEWNHQKTKTKRKKQFIEREKPENYHIPFIELKKLRKKSKNSLFLSYSKPVRGLHLTLSLFVSCTPLYSLLIICGISKSAKKGIVKNAIVSHSRCDILTHTYTHLCGRYPPNSGKSGHVNSLFPLSFCIQCKNKFPFEIWIY